MSKGEYEKVLRESGYKTISLIYTDKKDIKQKRNCYRKIIWFNLPSKKDVSTNIAKRFFMFLDQHCDFLDQPKKLYTIFDINTINKA